MGEAAVLHLLHLLGLVPLPPWISFPPSGEDTELPCSPCCGMGPWGVEPCFSIINFIPLKHYFQLFIALPAGESVPNWMKPTLIVVTLAFQSDLS